MSQSKNGVAAKEIERHVGVSYKCALRMTRQIRLLMSQSPETMLSGVVEADETWVGGVRRMSCRTENKTTVIGAVQRNGRVVARVAPNRTSATVLPLVRGCVKIGSVLMTDNARAYGRAIRDYNHHTVNHDKKEYVRGAVHTNSVEGFWSQMKRSISGTHHSVSPKHLQSYVDQFVFLYNHRASSVPMFEVLMRKMAA